MSPTNTSQSPSTTAVVDHVAVAVPSIDVAAARWHDELGGGWVTSRSSRTPYFSNQVVRYGNRAKLELLEPKESGFMRDFLDRFGARVHHVTLKVDALLPAVERIRAAGYDVIDVSTERPEWHEGFLRPSQVGGLVVQIAHSPLSDADRVRLSGPEEPAADDAAHLLGPTLFHPDPAACAHVWQVLGATVETGPWGIEASWPDTALTVRIEQGDKGHDPVLRVGGRPSLPADATLGPATVALG